MSITETTARHTPGHPGPLQLRRMLQARTIAVVGASDRPGSLGERMVTEALRCAAGVDVHLVNPARESVRGRPCLPSLHDLPQAPDLVLLGVADSRLHEQVVAAGQVGAGGAVVFGSAHTPGVRDAVRDAATDAGMALCGAGCMGFLDAEHGVRALGYQEREEVPAGPVALVTHSGSVFSALLRTRRALGFTVAVSSGQELVTSTADYVDHVVDHTSTRVLALVLETVRDGPRLLSSLRRARRAGIDVVLLPLGSSPPAAAMVASHSGAVAGGRSAWEAVCEATGSTRVGDLAEFVDVLELLSVPRRPRARDLGLATVHDSGGERSLLVDVAADLEVPLADLGASTTAALATVLDTGLEATNPLDVWGEGRDTRDLFGTCLTVVATDPAVGATALAVDLLEEYDGDTAYVDAVLDVAATTAGPLVVLTGLPCAVDLEAARTLRAAGVPVLEGTRSGLAALRHLLRPPLPPELPTGADGPAQRRPGRPGRDATGLDPEQARDLLAEYGVDAPEVRLVATEQEAVAAAVTLGARCGGRVVLKTARADIAHKSDVGGVVVGVDSTDRTAVGAAYRSIAERLGPRVGVHAQAPPGVEVCVGSVTDPQLGPLVVLAAGGVTVELLDDAVALVPPLTPERVLAALARLRVSRLLRGWRGAAACDVDALAAAVVGVGEMALDLADAVSSIDVNPLRVAACGAQALDLLVVPHPSTPEVPCSA